MSLWFKSTPPPSPPSFILHKSVFTLNVSFNINCLSVRKCFVDASWWVWSLIKSDGSGNNQFSSARREKYFYLFHQMKLFYSLMVCKED